MQDSLLRELTLTTRMLPSGMVELTVADTGPGLTDDMRERLFLPYSPPSSAAQASAFPSPQKFCRNTKAAFAPKRTCPPARASSSSFVPHQTQ